MLKEGSVHERALLQIVEAERICLSAEVWGELSDVMHRPKFDSLVSPARRRFITNVILDAAVWFEPQVTVTDCRDPGDDKYLELAQAASARCIVSSDADLLTLNPWRTIPILAPARYLQATPP